MAPTLKLRLFDPKTDGLWYTEWWHARGFLKVPLMPKVNIVVFDDSGFPIAAGGLVLTDSNFVFPDGFCANPDASKEQRQRGLQEVSKWAVETTLKLGFEAALFVTSSSSIVAHAIMGSEAVKSKAIDFEAFEDCKVFKLEVKK